jgi:hypothetical protein
VGSLSQVHIQALKLIFANSVYQAYRHIQNGLALDDVRLSEAVDHFTAAVNVISFSSTLAIHSKYDVFVVVS